MDLVVTHIIIIVILKLRMIVMTAEINNNRWLSSCWMRPGPELLASELSEPLGWGGFCRSVNPISTRVSRLCPPNYYSPLGFSDLPTGLLLEKLA